MSSSVAVAGGGGSYTNIYEYDPNGNRLSFSSTKNQEPGTTNIAVYDPRGRLLRYGDMTFGFSVNGEQLTRTSAGQTMAYEWDLFGQLDSVAHPGGAIIGYEQDALGRIVKKTVDGVAVQGWIYKDGLKPIAETDGAGDIVSVFVYGSSALTPDYMIRDGVTYRIIRDHVGSVRLVVNAASGVIAQRLDYDEFGNVLQDTAPGFQPFGFQSGLYDPDTGLVKFGVRWYDSECGRWISADPTMFDGGLNHYVFCGNDPVNFVDPWGLCEDVAKIVDIFWKTVIRMEVTGRRPQGRSS
ncbi:MAG: hypothetical protein LC725_07350 [Lentisphaerae bacterium]|nr:hypothetical protein [Lentisphaerota bacterium]